MRSFLPPLALLGALLAFSWWNCAAVSAHTERWNGQLAQIDALAAQEDWPAVLDALEASYADWDGCQTYLHIVETHDAVDDAEAMFRRARAFALTEEPTEFRAEIADLRAQLALLAEMEQFSLRNIL